MQDLRVRSTTLLVLVADAKMMTMRLKVSASTKLLKVTANAFTDSRSAQRPRTEIIVKKWMFGVDPERHVSPSQCFHHGTNDKEHLVVNLRFDVECDLKESSKCWRKFRSRIHQCGFCGVQYCEPCYHKVLPGHGQRQSYTGRNGEAANVRRTHGGHEQYERVRGLNEDELRALPALDRRAAMQESRELQCKAFSKTSDRN